MTRGHRLVIVHFAPLCACMYVVLMVIKWRRVAWPTHAKEIVVVVVVVVVAMIWNSSVTELILL